MPLIILISGKDLLLPIEYKAALAPELVLTFTEEKIFCLSQELNHNSSVFQPVALTIYQMRCTDTNYIPQGFLSHIIPI